MAFVALLTFLLALLGVWSPCASALWTLPSETCISEEGGLRWLSGQGNVCRLDSLEICQQGPLTGNVLLTGALGGIVWDLGEDGDGALVFDRDANVTVSCLSVQLVAPAVEELQLLPVDLNTLMSPPFLRAATGPVSNLTVQDLEIRLGCDELLEWQVYLCSVRLPGMAQIQGNRIFIEQWRMGSSYLERVSLTCDPGSVKFTSTCSMAIVDSVEDVLAATQALQEPNLPLVLTLSRGLNFTGTNWPVDGVRITANVTLCATLDSTVAISFGLKTVLFTVDSKTSAEAFLSFRGCILQDLPLSYLPLSHPRRPFGILSTSLWPVYREEVAMGLFNCTLILTNEEFHFWSFWLSILISPIPSVRALANWSYANGVQIQPSGSDYIMLSSYYGRYTTLVDVRYQVSNNVYTTQQRKNILQITGDRQVPPTVVFQVRDSEDLFSALSGDDSPSAAQYGQYIILTQTISLSNMTVGPPGGVSLRYPTTFTTWPSSTVALDLGLARNIFAADASAHMKNLVVVNLGLGAEEEEFSGLASGLWAFNFSNWRSADQPRLSLEAFVLVVSCQEVEYYIVVTVDGAIKGDMWINSFQVSSYDATERSWISFETLATLRFTGQQVNITCTMPHLLDGVTVLPPLTADASGLLGQMDTPSTSKSERQELLLFSLLAITLPTALGAALFTYLVVKRRRIRQLCTSSSAADEEGLPAGKREHVRRGSMDSSDPENEDEVDEKRARPQEESSCCLRIPLPLRKSKFVNPLYEDANSLAPDVVLTGVLGRTNRGRALLPPPVGLPAVFGAEVPAAPASAVPFDRESGSLAAAAAGRMPFGASELPVELPVGEVEIATDDPGAEAADGDVDAFSPAVGRAGEPSGGPDCAELGLSLGASGSRGVEGQLPVAEEGLRRGDSRRSDGKADSGASARVRFPSVAVLTVAHSTPAMSAALRSGSQGSPSRPVLPLSGALSRSQSAFRRAAGPSGGGDAAGQAASDSVREDERQGSREAGPGPGSGPAMPDMQRLERLRRDIGDQHLEVQHSLGWGGCGVVYKGVWKGIQVAVKTVLLQGDSKQSRQFLTEAAISASLQHANVVTTYLYELRPLDEVEPGGSGVEIRVNSRSSDGSAGRDRMACWKLYIVQEFCELGTLKAAIDQGYFKGSRGSLPNMPFLLTIALDVASGLTHVHSKNVVHGDVTVSNVLLQTCPTRPQGCIAKVADFGLSVKFEAGQTHNSHMYGGTPHYMAPERSRGLLSKESDIFSLGVCLWELFCGTPPWRRNTAGANNRHYPGTSSSAESIGNVRSYNDLYGSGGIDAAAGGLSGGDVFPFPRSCPPEYASLVQACLSTDMRKRPTAAAVVAALQRLLRKYG